MLYQPSPKDLGLFETETHSTTPQHDDNEVAVVEGDEGGKARAC